MSSILGPIESAALCLVLGSVPKSEGSVSCAGDRFTVQGITYEVAVPAPATVQTLFDAWVGVSTKNAPITPDVNYNAGSYDGNGAYTSPAGFTNRQQEVASRMLPRMLLGQYAFKLIAVRAAALLVLDEVEKLRDELHVGTLKEMLDLLYAHGWRDLDGWTTAIGRPTQGWVIDGNKAEADAFWLAWHYAKLIAGTAQHWNAADVPDLLAIEGHPYYAFDEYPYLTAFQTWRPSNALLERETLTQYEGGIPWTFQIDVDTTLDPVLRSLTMPQLASEIYRMFATLGTAAQAIRKERGMVSFGTNNMGAILALFGKGTKASLGGGLPGEGGGAFTPGGGSGGGLHVPGLIIQFPDGAAPGGDKGKGDGKGDGKGNGKGNADGKPGPGPGGETEDGTGASTGWPWWKTGIAIATGAAAALGAGYVALRATGRLKNPVEDV